MTDSLCPDVSRAASQAASLVTSGRVLLGITGPPGAGKTTVAQQLVVQLCAAQGPDWSAYVPMDGFHLGDDALTALGRLDRKGAPDTFDADGYAATLARVRAATTDVFVPSFDRALEQPIAANLIVPATARLVITEGNYLLQWPAVRACLEQVWFVQVDPKERVRRLVARHIQFGKSPAQAADWVRRVDGSNADLINAAAGLADRVLDGTSLEFAP